MKKILITGASGFIGSFIVEETLRQGYDVYAAVRKSSSREYLQDERINFVELNLGSTEQLTSQLQDLQPDYVVHAAGVTKCIDRSQFFKVNTEGTRHLVDALKTVWGGREDTRLVFISSLSIFGAIREEQPYTEILDTDTPRPNTAYGESKLQAEKIVQASGLNFVILRPTGVYGPREKDYFLMAKSIKQHSDFSVGYKPQDITFVYVSDVVQAVMKALHADAALGKAYFLSDGEVYRSVAFSDLIHEELGRPWIIRIKAPIWLLHIITTLGDHYGRLTHTISALNNDKYHILRQRNWRCDISPARRDLGYDPQVQLAQGVKESIQWYKENKWL